MPVKLLTTSPDNTQTKSSFDRSVSAVLNTTIDTAKFTASISVIQNETVVKGTADVQDSTVFFTPDAELLSSENYTATLFINAKESGHAL